MKNILFAASEATPFMKTGGLADVVGALPEYFDKKYFDCRIIMPKYLCIKEELKEKMVYKDHFYFDYMGESKYVGILECVHNDNIYYFIDNEYYFSGGWPYGDWLFDLEKFIFFSQAVLCALPVIGFKPDVMHLHDWQSAIIAVYLKDRFRGGDFYKDIKSVVTIHNLKFQGVWDIPTIKKFTGLPDYYFAPDKLESYKNGNLLKGGIVYADAVTTVSPTYAKEIQLPFFGEGLDGLMRARDNSLRGIINGIDYVEFDPEMDERIPKRFSSISFRRCKPANKKKLQEELGLAIDEKKFMIGVVSRLTDQKGFDLINCVMEQICDENTQVVVLGTGDEKYQNMFRYFAWKYGDRVSAQIYYSEDMAHKIYASSDAFLMPSLFEPCGLSQLIAMRYGSLPIVRETGGLKDTVEPYNEYSNTGTGFSFANYNAHEMLDTINYAKKIYFTKKKDWNKMIERAMEKDFSWSGSALKYQELYDWLIGY